MGVGVDLGPLRSTADLAQTVGDLATLVEVGSRWGLELARAASDFDLFEILDREGPEAIDRAMIADLMLDRPRWRSHRRLRGPWEGWAASDPDWVALRDLRATRMLGQRPGVDRLRYENPLELVLVGSGMLIHGVIVGARMVRDWSAQRRVGAAGAREAEAEARAAEARVALLEWLVGEARRGQAPLPIGDLAQIVTAEQSKALDRLAENPITLELPPGAESAISDSD